MQPVEAVSSHPTDGNNDFWDRYVARIQTQGVKPTIVRWYVIRAEHYLRTVTHQRLADHTPQDVIHYLEKLGRTVRMTDWQYRQTVEAIQQVLCVADVAWAPQFDWAYWKASARTLPANHPTIAREVAPTTLMGNEELPRTHGGYPAAGRDTQATWRQALIAEVRRRGYSIRTEQAYERWVDRFLTFCDHANPGDVGSAEVLAFLQHLAVTRQVAANTQNQARYALAFFYTQVLHQPLDTFDGLVPAKRPQRLPVVLTRAEVAKLLAAMQGVHGLMAALMYGTGMRLMECIRLRVKDIDFAYRQITVRDGKGQKDRVVPLPQRPVETLQHHLDKVQRLHQDDLQAGYGAVFCPTHWHGSIRRPLRNGAGSMCFPARDCRLIRVVGWCVAITSMRMVCKRQCNMLHGPLPWQNRLTPIPCGTALPPICWKMAMTFARCRNYSDTPMSPPP